MSCEQGYKEDGNVVVCYNKSFSIENQLNIDNIILSRWNAAMNNGFFRSVFVPLAEKLILNFGSEKIILVGTGLTQLEKRSCQENLDFSSNISQTDQPIVGHLRIWPV